jgi:hypothetical protein
MAHPNPTIANARAIATSRLRARLGIRRFTRRSRVTGSRSISSTPKFVADREHRKQSEHLDGYIAESNLRGLFSELTRRGGQVLRRSKQDRRDASTFISRILMATFSAVVNHPQIFNEANISRPCRYIAQAGGLAQFAAGRDPTAKGGQLWAMQRHG